MDVLWPPCLESLTMHSFESEDTWSPLPPLPPCTVLPPHRPVNAAEPAYVWPHPSPTTMEDNDAEPSLVIDIVHIECE